ncbi:MAG: extracellular solute-binding protein [Eubacteriales bacterium]|nr:extracellular solute-binding protein [Eubacteriales bacterium]
MKKKMFKSAAGAAMALSMTATALCGSALTVSAEEPTEITVWAWDKTMNGTSMEVADSLDDSVTVNFVEMAKADCLQKIHTVLASGVTDDLPDIVLISDLNAQGYLMSYPDAFLPVDDYISYDDFASYKQEMVSYEGVGYGVPFDTGVAALFYRTDYMEEIGVTDEDMQDLTWEEYLALGEKLKEKGHMLQTYNPNDIAEFQIMLQSTGKWFTDDEGQADFVDNEALAECYDVFKKLNESDFCQVVSDWTGFAGAINGGDVACVIRGSWITSTIMAGEDQSGLWKMAPIPKMSTEGATHYSNQGGSSWFVLKNSENAEAAAQFLANTFGGSTELYDSLLKSNNIIGTYLPASEVEALDAESEYFSGQQINKTLVEWEAQIPSVNTGVYSAEAQSALLAVTPNILNGSDLATELESAAAQFNASVQ